MKKYTYILFTAGRGPVECGLAVQGIQDKFKKYLEANKLEYKVISQKAGQFNRSMETILFKVEVPRRDLLKPWLGTIQWICKSPVRKFSKRKNWFIKSVQVEMPEQKPLRISDLSIQAFRASGPGGQHRNKVETAIRVVHKPSGLIVTASDSKSKAQNKKSALEKLEAKLRQQNLQIQKGFDLEVWSSKLEIERGNPVKVFSGPKFKEV